MSTTDQTAGVVEAAPVLPTKWARKAEGYLEIIDFDPEDRTAGGEPFVPVDPELNDFVNFDYKVIDGKVVPPSLDYLKKQLGDLVAAKRYQVETGGVTLPDGAFIKTDRESQAQLSSAHSSLASGLIADTPWKAGAGLFIRVTLAEVTPIATAVAAHVRNCFLNEEALGLELLAIDNLADLVKFNVPVKWQMGWAKLNPPPAVKAPADSSAAPSATASGTAV